MSLLSKKQMQKRQDEENFRKSTQRAAFTSVILLMLMTAIIAVISLALFYTLNCPHTRDTLSEREKAVEQYSLTASPAGGCVGPPTAIFADGRGTAHSVTYLMGSGDIKAWQYVGDFPIYVYFHQGAALKIHLLDVYGNHTMEILGDVKTDTMATSLTLELPALHWHAWEPENQFPLTLASVITPSGTSDISQHPLTDIYTDPVLSAFLNDTDAMLSGLIMKYSRPATSDYCLKNL